MKAAVWVRPAILVLAALLMGGCASRGTRVVLLPQPDGSSSAVVVRTKGGEQLVSQPYQRATALTGSEKAPSLDQVDPKAVHEENKQLFDLAPPKPQSFVLYFDAGGTVLTPESKRELDDVIQSALAHPGADITVTGHTDTQGSTARNDQLGLQRANEIKGFLVQRGFPASRIEAAGRGERELLVPTADEVDEPRNRRVVVVVR